MDRQTDVRLRLYYDGFVADGDIKLDVLEAFSPASTTASAALGRLITVASTNSHNHFRPMAM
jgi:hypothetical protein